MHPKNKHQGKYDLDNLVSINPRLEQYLTTTPRGDQSIDFANPDAVKILNQAILKNSYGIDFWDFPTGHLCPAVPGRAEYIHHIAELLETESSHKDITCLDIGTGASCIYPIIAVTEYNWLCIGTDISSVSIKSAQRIIDNNPQLKNRVQLRHQRQRHHIFKHMIEKNESINVTICNPPFYGSAEESISNTKRKQRSLTQPIKSTTKSNFSGTAPELICDGGEKRFISTMIKESHLYRDQVKWFTSLVSKEKNLNPLIGHMKNYKPKDIRTIDINIGNKKSRILAWTF